jgi:hypothetical protein
MVPWFSQPDYQFQNAFGAVSTNHIRQRQKRQRFDTFVSCWHENVAESEALWQLYGGYSYCVAIRTSVGKLRNALHDYMSMAIGRVRYINLATEEVTMEAAAFRKRASLAHEREVRAVMYRPGMGTVVKDGLRMPVDLQQIIESVVVSANAAKWFMPLVRSVVKQYGIKVCVIKSESADEPFY